jgi:Xaa-Pro aminopeptidase
MPEILIERLNSELNKLINLDERLNNNATSNTFIERLADLRREIKTHEISGFMVPLADEHQGEYVPKNAQRLAWLTGFTGSAGMAIIQSNKAVIFVDGRYTLQAQQQVNQDLFEISNLNNNSIDNWILESLAPGEILGFDPWLHTSDAIVRLKKTTEKMGVRLTATKNNPVDTVWLNRPEPPLTPVILMEHIVTGKTSSEKRTQIAKILKQKEVSSCVLTAPDSIAWLANIRGSDVPYTPFSLAFAIFHANGDLAIFNDPRKFSIKVREKLDPGISIIQKEEFLPTLSTIAKRNEKIGIDLSTSAEIIATTLRDSGAQLQRFSDPCQLPKAIKNSDELTGMRQAHLRDGIALTKFLAWLDENSASGNLTELTVADKLESFRREGNGMRGLSFPTRSGSGPHGAIVHYRVTQMSNRKLKKDTLYLVDSGAQYIDGTTDVTRTISIGSPSPEMKDRFTRVLRGHIALAMAVFPQGTCGSQLDALARTPLWEIGLDYAHGTGHGVGSYLSVHEGPQRISKWPSPVALEPGMVVSNEPGYYKTGAYGIRIENLVAVVKVPEDPSELKANKPPFLCFETLTLAPIDLLMVEKGLLNQTELNWLNKYHRKVKTSLLPYLDKKTQDWLEFNARELS